MHDIAFLVNVGTALAAALVGGLIARAVKLPVLVGYLLAGIAVGPHTPGVFADAKTVRPVAEMGVALLMFTVGVRFSLEELRSVRRIALLGGGLQILGTIVLGLALGWLLAMGVYGGLFLGCALSLSSTAVMMRILEERGELGSTHGAAMLGILVVQDLSLVAMVAVLPALAHVGKAGMGALGEVGLSLLLALLLIAGTLLLAQRGVPAILNRVTRFGSRELFLITVVVICLAAAALAEVAGISLALGAFLAGLVVSESDYAHDVFAQVTPLRDLFASLFFVSVGMLLSPAFVLANLGPVLVVVAAIVVVKALIAAGAVFLAGAHGRTAVLTGLGLAQIGEFSFVLTQIGNNRGLVQPELSNIVVSAALITLLLTPFTFGAAAPLYCRLSQVPALARLLNRRPETQPHAHAHGIAPRVVILGGGRVGSYLSTALRERDVPHVVVDYHYEATSGLRAAGVPVVYGDAASDVVLAQAHPEEADLAVVALPEAATTEMAVRALKRLAPELSVFARVHRADDVAQMRHAGADVVIHAEFEAAAAMIDHSLVRLGVTPVQIDDYLRGVRDERDRRAAADMDEQIAEGAVDLREPAA